MGKHAQQSYVNTAQSFDGSVVAGGTYKRLGAIAPADDKEYLLYTAPNGTQSLVSNITVANRSSSSASFDINVYESGVTQQSDLGPDPENIISIGYGFIGSSTDGLVWTKTTVSELAYSIYDVIVRDNKIITMGADARVGESTDGITWTIRTQQDILNIGSGTWRLKVMNGKYFAFKSSSSDMAYSDSPTGPYTKITLPMSNSWVHPEYANGVYVMVANDDHCVRSTDGLSWQPIYIAGNLHNTLTFFDNKFVTLRSNTNSAKYSTDGVLWTQVSLPTSMSWATTAVGNGVIVAGGNSTSQIIARSTDGVTWTPSTLPAATATSEIVFREGKFLTNVWVSPNYFIYYSTDGITWSQESAAFIGKIIPNDKRLTFSSPLSTSLYKRNTISANETQIIEPGIALSASASIVAKDNSGGNLTFSTYGVELS